MHGFHVWMVFDDLCFKATFHIVSILNSASWLDLFMLLPQCCCQRRTVSTYFRTCRKSSPDVRSAGFTAAESLPLLSTSHSVWEPDAEKRPVVWSDAHSCLQTTPVLFKDPDCLVHSNNHTPHHGNWTSHVYMHWSPDYLLSPSGYNHLVLHRGEGRSCREDNAMLPVWVGVSKHQQSNSWRYSEADPPQEKNLKQGARCMHGGCFGKVHSWVVFSWFILRHAFPHELVCVLLHFQNRMFLADDFCSSYMFRFCELMDFFRFNS